MRSRPSSSPITGRGNSRGSSVRGLVRTTARTLLPAIALDLHQGAEAAMEGRRAAGNETRLEHFEDLLARGAEAHGALHVGHQPRALAAAKGEQRDGDELAHLGRDVRALAQTELVDAVVRLDKIGILPRGEL